MSEKERKPGDLARKAAKDEATENAPASLDTMLGAPAPFTFAGRQVQLFPVTLGRMKRFSAAMQKLEDLGLFALVEGKPEVMARLNVILGRVEEDRAITVEDVDTGLKLLLLQPSEAQVDAMIEIAELALNGTAPDGVEQSIPRAVIEERLTPPAFLALYRTTVAISGLNP